MTLADAAAADEGDGRLEPALPALLLDQPAKVLHHRMEVWLDRGQGWGLGGGHCSVGIIPLH